MGRKPSPRDLERRLRQYTAEYDALKARLQDIGFICMGSLVTRWTSCGKPNCVCHRDPEQRHGPYHQLTWKEDGVTVTRRLSPEHARLYQEWMENRRHLESLLDQMQQVSAKAGQQLLRAAEPASPADSTPRRNRPRKHS
jgi:hypothetical protein